MARTFQDRNFLVWECYSSTDSSASSKNPWIIFHCLSTTQRSRGLPVEGDTADAERTVATASEAELLALLDRASAIR